MLLNCGSKDSWESHDCKEIQQVHPKGDQSWLFIGRTDVEAETPILCQPDVKSWLIWKDPDAGEDWGQAEKGMTDDEMVGWHHWLNGHEFGWTPGVDDGQGGLACCSPWGRRELDTTERLKWNDKPSLVFPLDTRLMLSSTDPKLSPRIETVLIFTVLSFLELGLIEVFELRVRAYGRQSMWSFKALKNNCNKSTCPRMKWVIK